MLMYTMIMHNISTDRIRPYFSMSLVHTVTTSYYRTYLLITAKGAKRVRVSKQVMHLRPCIY